MSRYLFYEKPRGLDFSLRQKSKKIKKQGNHGYALTQKKSFDEIMRHLDITSKDSFIDIGCGKGGCLLYAIEHGFGRVAGIEVEKSLYDMAVNNFKRLKLSERVEIFNEDAAAFRGYGRYNVFYFFNPFDADIYKRVVDNIINQILENPGRNIYMICYGASIREYIKDTNRFFLVHEYTDHIRNTDVCIWKYIFMS